MVVEPVVALTYPFISSVERYTRQYTITYMHMYICNISFRDRIGHRIIRKLNFTAAGQEINVDRIVCIFLFFTTEYIVFRMVDFFYVHRGYRSF